MWVAGNVWSAGRWRRGFPRESGELVEAGEIGAEEGGVLDALGIGSEESGVLDAVGTSTRRTACETLERQNRVIILFCGI